MKKQFLAYTIPSALAMFVSSLYTIVDGIFVGQGVGDAALAAVNIVLPLTIMLFGTATMFAVGGGALVSKNFGAGKIDEGVYAFRQTFKFLIIVSVGISLICVLFPTTIVRGLGATDSLLELSSEYLRFYALFCIPNLVGIALNSFVRNDGQPRLAMVSTISGAITNIILDYIFIFEFGWGIRGAAIASGLGQLLTVAIILPHFWLKRGNLTFGNVPLDSTLIREFSMIGLPSFLAEAAYSMIIFVHNLVIVQVAGEAGIAAFSVINYIITNIYLLILGLTFGAQPLISFNYGAGNRKEMLQLYRMTVIAGVLVTIGYSSICLVWGEQLISIFTSDPEIIRMSYIGLNIENMAYFAIAANLTTTMYYQAIEMPKYSNILCLFRSLIFLPLCSIVLAKTLGLNGVWLSLLASEVLSFFAVTMISRVKVATSRALEQGREKLTIDDGQLTI